MSFVLSEEQISGFISDLAKGQNEMTKGKLLTGGAQKCKELFKNEQLKPGMIIYIMRKPEHYKKKCKLRFS